MNMTAEENASAWRDPTGILRAMETPAQYFTRVKGNQQQALKMLGHPVFQASKSSASSTGPSMKTQAGQSATSSTSRATRKLPRPRTRGLLRVR
jgi:hypothetical protein